MIHFGTRKPLLPYLYARVLVIEDFVFLENSAAAVIEVHSNLKAIKKRLILESLEKLGDRFQFLSWRFPRPPKMIQSNLLQKADNTGIREKPLDGQ